MRSFRNSVPEEMQREDLEYQKASPISVAPLRLQLMIRIPPQERLMRKRGKARASLVKIGRQQMVARNQKCKMISNRGARKVANLTNGTQTSMINLRKVD